MGNFTMKAPLLKKDSYVKVVHDKYSEYQEIPDNILRIGQVAKVIKSDNLYQSRPDQPVITYAKVQFRDGTVDAYIATNLKPTTI
jgi:hypothetical protein